MYCKGFEPCIFPDSEILILGSFPSVKSREVEFYYGHPQNRFWRVLAGIFGEDTPVTLPQKKELLKKHKIALWDIVTECEIVGSMDANIKNPVIADLNSVIPSHNIKKIIANGKTAYKLLSENFPEYAEISVYLPSTSPANPRFSLEEWKKQLIF